MSSEPLWSMQCSLLRKKSKGFVWYVLKDFFHFNFAVPEIINDCQGDYNTTDVSSISINVKTFLESENEAITLSKCQHERRKDLLSRRPDKFIVECEENGDYKVEQCWNGVGLCWCVRIKEGTEIFGSRTYFPNKPKCKLLGK